MVLEEGIPINQARKELNLKYPTAKSIIQRFRKYGHRLNHERHEDFHNARFDPGDDSEQRNMNQSI